MSAVATSNQLAVSPARRLSELQASREISRVAASGLDVSSAIDAIAHLALRVNGIRKIQITYADSVDGAPSKPIVWGGACEDGLGSAVANITSSGHTWGELRLYFDLQPSALESPLRFARYVAQQIGTQLTHWHLATRADEWKAQISRLQKIVDKRKTVQRARAILANEKQIGDGEALRVMREYCETSGRSLHDVAEAIIFSDAQKWTTGSRYLPRRRQERPSANWRSAKK